MCQVCEFVSVSEVAAVGGLNKSGVSVSCESVTGAIVTILGSVLGGWEKGGVVLLGGAVSV